MKRDMDLARALLLAIEACEDKNSALKVEGDYSQEVMTYHLGLLYHAGLITAEDMSGPDHTAWMPTGLTWEGHDFVEAARNDTYWNSVKSSVKDKGGALTFEVAKGLLGAIAKAHMGLH